MPVSSGRPITHIITSSPSSSTCTSSTQSSAAESIQFPPSISSQSSVNSDHPATASPMSAGSLDAPTQGHNTPPGGPSSFNNNDALSITPLRSSSLPFMGQNYSKSSGPVAAAGSKLKRAFAARRKHSTSNESSSLSPSEAAASAPQVTPAHHPRNARQLTLQMAAQVFSGGGKKSARTPVDAPSPVPPVPPPKPFNLRKSVPPPVRTHDQLAVSDTTENRGSIMPISPGISSAVNYMIGEDQRQQQRQQQQAAQEPSANSSNSKETWRKSDSTISHHTIRPGANAGSRASRPVSTAESAHSTHTIVPVNKRLSALITDADFATPEEDSEVSPTSQDAALALRRRPSPASSLRSKNRRSMSLNLGPSAQFKTAPSLQPSYPPPSKSLDGVSPVVTPSTPTPTLSRAAANGIISPPSSGLQSTGNNIRGRLAAWSATNLSAPRSASHSQPPPPPPKHPQLERERQPAVSITSGLAKRAAEKMGMGRWGFGSSPSSSSHSHSSSNISNLSNHNNANNSGYSSSSSSGTGPSSYEHPRKMRHRRTPNSPSASSNNTNASSVSMSMSTQEDEAPVGPSLGKCVRNPSKGKGLVFGRPLAVVVRETRQTRRTADDGEWEQRGGVVKGDLRALEWRMLPALVMRCAQHLMIWGIQEEGLFRLNGRPSHVSKLRTEFDAGADYDMSECSPGDLDPHAVASVFKAFLRELPEPLLTHALIPYFEAALQQENASQSEFASSQPRLGRSPPGPGLPSGPRPSQAQPNLPLRKPPSLSTLALPTFSGPRPSHSLTLALRSLISKLPAENRDLLQTVTELIRATAKEVKETKMPLSNLLLVFCPSLGMGPGLLKSLCEAEGIWSEIEEMDVIDIKRQSVVLDIRPPETDAETDVDVEGEGEELLEEGVEDEQEADEPAMAEEDQEEGVIVRSRPRARAKRALARAMYLDDSEGGSADDSSLSQILAPTAASSKTPETTDDASSMIASDLGCLRPDAPSPLLSSSAESLATPRSNSSGVPSFTDLPIENDPYAKPSRSMPLVIADDSDSTSPSLRRRPLISGPIQFPTTGSTPSTPLLAAKRSIPVLSLPNFPLMNDSPGSTNSAPASPFKRLKRPSLHLLFSKRSASALTGSSGGTYPNISGPFPYLQPSSKAASDSSVSTPASAVTAPQSASELPPVLDTPIESSSLHLGLGLDGDSPEPDRLMHEKRRDTAETVKQPVINVDVAPRAQTPISDWYRSPAQSKSTHSLILDGLAPHLRPEPTRKSSKTSIASTASSNHLGLLDRDEEAEEDWTQSVLLAADVDWRMQASATVSTSTTV